MRKFYLLTSKLATLSQQLSFCHHVELLPINDLNQINYYISISEQYNLSIRELRSRIKSKEYERLSEETKLKLRNKEENKIQDFIKNPIIIKNSSNIEIISEKILKQLIVEDIDSFLKELGDGFSYVANEYKIKKGNKYVIEYSSDSRIYETTYIINN